MILSVLKYYLISARNYFKQGGWPKWLVAVAFVLITLVTAVVVFFLFEVVFRFLLSQEKGLQVLTFYSIGVAFFLIFALLIISDLLFLSRQLFVGGGIRLLLSLPMSPLKIFSTRFIISSVVTSWPIYVFGLPLILALVYSHELSLVVFVEALLLLVPFILVALFWSAILVFGFSYILGRFASRFIAIALVILIPALGYLTINTLFPSNIETIFESLDKEVARETLLSFTLFSNFLPSTWFVKGIWGLVEPETNFFLNSLAILWLVCLSSFTLVLLLAKNYFLASVQKLQEGVFLASPSFPDTVRKVTPARFYESKSLTLIKKEALAIFRDSHQVSYIGFLLLLFFIYIFAILKVPNLKDLDPEFAAFILAGNFAFIGYLQTIISLRFGYPSMSLEGKSAWVLWSLPLKIEKVLSAKVVFYTLGVVSIGIIFSIITGVLFSFNLFLWGAILTSSLIIGVFVSAFPLALGSLFPNFEADSQDAASTSASGLLAAGVCLLAVGGFSFMLWIFLKGYFSLYTPESFDFQSVVDFLVVTGVYGVALNWFLFYFAGKKLRSYDF